MKEKTPMNALRGKIVEKYGTASHFADALGMTRACLSNKLTGKNELTVADIRRMQSLLQLDEREFVRCFFPGSEDTQEAP